MNVLKCYFRGSSFKFSKLKTDVLSYLNLILQFFLTQLTIIHRANCALVKMNGEILFELLHWLQSFWQTSYKRLLKIFFFLGQWCPFFKNSFSKRTDWTKLLRILQIFLTLPKWQRNPIFAGSGVVTLWEKRHLLIV